jgi:hypothetical protein
VTLVRDVRGRRLEREVGPRARLTVEEAAAVLDRPVAAVRIAIRAGFLRVRQVGGRAMITLAECQRYLREESEDRAAVRARRQQRRYPAEKVHARLGL